MLRQRRVILFIFLDVTHQCTFNGIPSIVSRNTTIPAQITCSTNHPPALDVHCYNADREIPLTPNRRVGLTSSNMSLTWDIEIVTSSTETSAIMCENHQRDGMVVQLLRKEIAIAEAEFSTGVPQIVVLESPFRLKCQMKG